MKTSVRRHALWMIACLTFVAAPAAAEPKLPDLTAIIGHPKPANTDFDGWAETTAQECLKGMEPMSFPSPIPGLLSIAASDGLRVQAIPGTPRGVEVLYFDYQGQSGGYYHYQVTGITADPAICGAPSVLPCILTYASEVAAWVIDVITDPNAHMPSAGPDSDPTVSGPPPVEEAISCV